MAKPAGSRNQQCATGRTWLTGTRDVIIGGWVHTLEHEVWSTANIMVTPPDDVRDQRSKAIATKEGLLALYLE